MSTDGDINLRLDGKVVSRCCVDTAFSLEFLEKGFRTVIRIGGLMDIEDGQTSLSLSGEKPTQAKEACILLGKTVQKGVARKDGKLDIKFSDGSLLIVPADPNYEAWEISATDGFFVVGLPGGGLTTWRSRNRRDL